MKQDILTFLSQRSPHRQSNPKAFFDAPILEEGGNQLKREERQKLMERYLATPMGIRGKGSYTDRFDCSPRLSTCDEELLMRKIKAGNYGKWYLQPQDYNKRIDVLNQKIQRKIYKVKHPEEII
jgi:hypothetical protein